MTGKLRVQTKIVEVFGEVTLYMQVLEQPEDSRGEGDLEVMGDWALVSGDSPAFQDELVAVRGIERDLDLDRATRNFPTVAEAREYEDNIAELVHRYNAGRTEADPEPGVRILV